MKRLFAIFIICTLTVATAYAQDDSREKMAKDYEQLIKKGLNNVDSHRSFIQKWKEKSDELIPIYENLAANSPDNPVIQYALGYLYGITEKDEFADQAIFAFQKAIELDPNFLMAHFSLGGMYLRKKNYKPAEIEFQKVIELDGNFYTAYFNLGEVYRNQKRYDLAILAYNKCLEIKKRWGWPHYGLGVIYLDQDRLEDAETELKQAIGYNPEIAMAHFKLGQLYAKQDREIELISEQYREGQKYDKTNAYVFYELGLIFAEKGNSGLAIQSYKNAISIDPDMAEASFQLGEEYYNTGLQERAIEYYKEAIRAEPSFRRHFLDEVKQYYEVKNFDAATVTLDKLLAIEPENSSAHYYYAEILRQSNKVPDAIKHYEDAVRSDPNLLEAYIPLGDLYYSQGKKEDAARVYRKAIGLDPDLEKYFFDEGAAELEVDEFSAAVTNLDKFVLLYPEDVLLDADVYYRVSKEAAGLDTSAEALALDIIKEVGPRGHFLAQRHTRINMRKRLFSELTNQPKPGGGYRDPVEVAKEKVEWIIANHHPQPLEQAQRDELSIILKAADQEHR